MQVLRVFLFLSIVIVIAGCVGLNAPTQLTGPQQTGPQPNPQPSPQGPEFLYVGTSKSGLLTFQIQAGGSLKQINTSASVPDSICYALLSATPGKIYSLSQLCPFSDDPMELRRFDLGPSGEITGGAGPFSLQPALPSDTGHILGFVTAPEGNFAYARSLGGASEYITPVQIDAAGNMAARPDLGISWPRRDSISADCEEWHSPITVTATSEGMFLVVADERICLTEAPVASYLIFPVDSQTGVVGGLIGEVKVDSPLDPSRLFTAQNGALMVVGQVLPGETGSLKLFHIGMDGVRLLQQCQSDQPACAHPLTMAFHPSGKWLFVLDVDANWITHGIWTIPIARGSLVAAKASFVAAPDGAYKFAFSSDGRSLYVSQWVNNTVSGQISGFRVDDGTGALTPLTGSPWNLGTEFGVTSMVHTGAGSR